MNFTLRETEIIGISCFVILCLIFFAWPDNSNRVVIEEREVTEYIKGKGAYYAIPKEPVELSKAQQAALNLMYDRMMNSDTGRIQRESAAAILRFRPVSPVHEGGF